MRREWSWALAAVAACTIGATCAEGYARLATPYYDAIAAAIAEWHPWRITAVAVARDERSHGAVLSLISEVRRNREDRRPAAIVVSRIAVGEVIEAPLVFWTLLLLWPAPCSVRQRLLRLAVGIPVFLGLEAATTACQLLHPLAEASAVLAGERDPLTLWERWSRFLEAGGRFALEITAALLSVAMASRARPGDRPSLRNVTVTCGPNNPRFATGDCRSARQDPRRDRYGFPKNDFSGD